MQSSSAPSVAGDSREKSTKPHFFTLSAELRNRIYDFALGGKTIHILAIAARRPSPILASVCLASDNDEQGDAPCRVVSLRVRNNAHNDCIKHSCGSLPTKVDLALLGVCRQIYDETALLPYASNNFLVHMQEDGFRTFMEHMAETQLAAIQHIILDFSNYGSVSPYKPFADLKTLRRLASVKKVTLVVKSSHAQLGQQSFKCIKDMPRLRSLDVTMVTRWDDTDLVVDRATALTRTLRRDVLGKIAEQ